MDIIGILTLGAFLWVAGWQFGKWLYKRYVSAFVRNVLWGKSTYCVPYWGYSGANYPMDKLIILDNRPLVEGDYIIAQNALYINGRRNESWMRGGLKVVKILPAHIILHDKDTVRHELSDIIMTKPEFQSRDFRHLTEEEKKYLAF